MLLRLWLALVLATGSICASATDYSDIWWNPAEPGWGVNFAQSGNFIFATFFVYGLGNVPTFYVGNLTLDETGAYKGGLYATTGTYFGTVPYNPAEFKAPPAGTATFKPSAADKGLLTYNVGAVPVVKNIQRQTLTPIPLAGSYVGGVSVVESACSSAGDNGSASLPVNFSVTQSPTGQFQLVADLLGFGTCTFVSTSVVAQNGQLFSFTGTSTCGTDPPYAVTVSELRTTSLGIEGRWTAPNAAGCHEEGQFGGVVAY